MIKIGMPEVLVLYSLIMYPQSYILSLVALVLGIVSRLVCYTSEKDLDDKLKLQQLNSNNKEIL